MATIRNKSLIWAIQIWMIIEGAAKEGKMLPRTIDSLVAAIKDKSGQCCFDFKDPRKLTAYAEAKKKDGFVAIISLAVSAFYRGQGLALLVIIKATDFALNHYPDEPIFVVANNDSLQQFLAIGYEIKDKELAPPAIWGGRTKREWLNCRDRNFLVLNKAEYKRRVSSGGKD